MQLRDWYNQRYVMRQAAVARRQAGDKLMFVVEGLELFGEPDKDLFADPLHPNDEGNERMAQRLAPRLEKALALTPLGGGKGSKTTGTIQE